MVIPRHNDARKVAETILNSYKPENTQDIQEAMKDVFGEMIQMMMNAEFEHHLGYKHNEKKAVRRSNTRNGSYEKTLKTTYGEVPITTPRDRNGSFQPVIVPKRQTDISGIEGKVLSLYAKGMSQRDISDSMEDIYGFKISHETISEITDLIIPEMEEWQSRPLKKCYAFLFVDCMFVYLRDGYETKECAVYTILGYDLSGQKEILGMWLNETESKSRWMQIFDEIKQRGVEDVFFISMDGVSGLEDGAKSIFPGVIVQRCIVHLVRNALKFVPSKDYKEVCKDTKSFYRASNVKKSRVAFEAFKDKWSKYPGAIDVWERNFAHVEQLYNYGSAIRKVMYTTNAIESINSSFRKVTKKGSFPNEAALFKLLYLREKELERKWDGGHLHNWPLVMNQLMTDEKLSSRIRKYQYLLGQVKLPFLFDIEPRSAW